MINEPGIYIGIGMVLSLLATETLGVTAGGIIVPGYIAMEMDHPEKIIITFCISLVTFGIIQLLSRFMLIYGKRRLVLALLMGFLLGYFFRSENNILSGYLTDVLNEEPMIANHPFLKYNNIFVTPHIGSRTYESVERQGIMAVENLVNSLG